MKTNKTGGCIDCRNNESDLIKKTDSDGNFIGFDVLHSCKISNTLDQKLTCINYWENAKNGERMELPCFQQTETSKSLDEISSLLDELLKRIG